MIDLELDNERHFGILDEVQGDLEQFIIEGVPETLEEPEIEEKEEEEPEPKRGFRFWRTDQEDDDEEQETEIEGYDDDEFEEDEEEICEVEELVHLKFSEERIKHIQNMIRV